MRRPMEPRNMVPRLSRNTSPAVLDSCLEDAAVAVARYRFDGVGLGRWVSDDLGIVAVAVVVGICLGRVVLILSEWKKDFDDEICNGCLFAIDAALRAVNRIIVIGIYL